MQGDDVRRAHEPKGRGFDGGNQRRIPVMRKLSEELVVEGAEEGDRLRFRHPEEPGVELRQRGEPPCAEERLRVDDGERGEERGHGGEPRQARAHPRRQAPPEPDANDRRDDRDEEAGAENRGDGERDGDDERPDEDDTRRSNAEHVRQPG